MVRVLSLGAGVQSSFLLLRNKEDYHFAVFADTGDEPEEVYIWFEKLKNKSNVKILTGQRAKLSEEPAEHGFSTVPLFYVDNKTGKKGMGRRFCTSLYKIQVVNKVLRKELGYKFRQRMKHDVHMYMGISKDEEGRANIAREKWKTHHFPLIEQNIYRSKCLFEVERIMGQKPPRSACVFCPYKRDAEFLEMIKNDFAKAVKFDEKIRHLRPGVTQYVHRSLKPLKYLKDNYKKEQHQWSFEEMCDGGCGL